MKTFETPYVEVKKFDVQDILTSSGEGELPPPPPPPGDEGQYCI